MQNNINNKAASRLYKGLANNVFNFDLGSDCKITLEYIFDIHNLEERFAQLDYGVLEDIINQLCAQKPEQQYYTVNDLLKTNLLEHNSSQQLQKDLIVNTRDKLKLRIDHLNASELSLTELIDNLSFHNMPEDQKQEAKKLFKDKLKEQLRPYKDKLLEIQKNISSDKSAKDIDQEQKFFTDSWFGNSYARQIEKICENATKTLNKFYDKSTSAYYELKERSDAYVAKSNYDNKITSIINQANSQSQSEEEIPTEVKNQLLQASKDFHKLVQLLYNKGVENETQQAQNDKKAGEYFISEMTHLLSDKEHAEALYSAIAAQCNGGKDTLNTESLAKLQREDKWYDCIILFLSYCRLLWYKKYEEISSDLGNAKTYNQMYTLFNDLKDCVGEKLIDNTCYQKVVKTLKNIQIQECNARIKVFKKLQDIPKLMEQSPNLTVEVNLINAFTKFKQLSTLVLNCHYYSSDQFSQAINSLKNCKPITINQDLDEQSVQLSPTGVLVNDIKNYLNTLEEKLKNLDLNTLEEKLKNLDLDLDDDQESRIMGMTNNITNFLTDVLKIIELPIEGKIEDVSQKANDLLTNNYNQLRDALIVLQQDLIDKEKEKLDELNQKNKESHLENFKIKQNSKKQNIGSAI